MVKLSYDVNKRFKQLITFDSIRQLKILEMFQYNFVGFILVTIVAYICDKFIFEKSANYFVRKHKTGKNKDKSRLGFFILFFVTMIETFMILVILFYMRKILLLLPPIGPRLNKGFKGLTTMGSVLNLTLSFLFLEFVSGYREKTGLILNYEFD